MKIKIKQWTVDMIVYLFPVMPIRFKVWAFMNDGVTHYYKFWSN